LNDLGLDVEVWGVFKLFFVLVSGFVVCLFVGLHGEVSTSLHLHHLGELSFGMWFMTRVLL
jgi:hypothetical protein